MLHYHPPSLSPSKHWAGSGHRLFGQRRCLASSPHAHKECSQYSQCKISRRKQHQISITTHVKIWTVMLRLEALFHKFHVGTMFISDLLPESQANPRPTPTARVSKKQNKNTMFLVTASKAQDMKHWTRLKTRYIQVLNVCIQGVIDSKVFWVGSSFIFLTLPLAPSFDFRFPIGLRKENPNGTGSSPKVQRTAQLHWLQTDKTINVDAVNLSARRGACLAGIRRVIELQNRLASMSIYDGFLSPADPIDLLCIGVGWHGPPLWYLITLTTQLQAMSTIHVQSKELICDEWHWRSSHFVPVEFGLGSEQFLQRNVWGL